MRFGRRLFYLGQITTFRDVDLDAVAFLAGSDGYTTTLKQMQVMTGKGLLTRSERFGARLRTGSAESLVMRALAWTLTPFVWRGTAETQGNQGTGRVACHRSCGGALREPDQAGFRRVHRGTASLRSDSVSARRRAARQSAGPVRCLHGSVAE